MCSSDLVRLDLDAQMTGTLPGLPQNVDRPAEPEWLAGTRAELPTPGRYLAYEQDGQVVVHALTREWTRIGRSQATDVRFDDATVSRRPALIASEDAAARVLDDRALNGIQVNGRRVDWSPLADGDVISIGRHAIHYLDTTDVPATTRPAALAE